MIGLVNERIPRNVRNIVKPKICFNVGKKLVHDWGSVIILEKYIVIRKYGCPQPPHILPKYVLEWLGFVELFWQLVSLNREYLGKTIKKGTFLCRCTKVGDFEIGKNSIEETDSFLRSYILPTGPARTYDPCNIVRNALKNTRGYTLPLTKPLRKEDVIDNRLNEDIYRERMIKYKDVLSFEQEMKKVDSSFKGFYSKEDYWSSLDKCVQIFDEI